MVYWPTVVVVVVFWLLFIFVTYRTMLPLLMNC